MALRSEIRSAGICSSDDGGEFVERRIVELVFFQERIEAAQRPIVRKLYAGHVEGRSTGFFDGLHHVVGRHEEKLCFLVDEPCGDIKSGALLDRLTTVSKPCCIERIPSESASPVRALVSNIGDGTLQMIEVTENGKIRPLEKAIVGKAPKRVAFLSASP